MAIIEISDRFSSRSPLFFDQETKAKYRRIVAGFAWPSIKPGFVIVVGEDYAETPSTKVRNMRVLTEAEDLNPMGLFRNCLEFRKLYRVQDFLGDLRNRAMMGFLSQFNNDLRMRNVPTLSFQFPPHITHPESFKFYAISIKRHLDQGKSLHFGQNLKAPGYLMELTPEAMTKASLSDFLAIAALGYAVAFLDIYEPVFNLKTNYKRIAESYSHW